MPDRIDAAPLRYRYVDAPHGQIHLAEAGEGESLLLLGGAPRSGRQFETLIPFLSGRHRLIVPDMPGFGNSAALPEGMTIEDVAAALVAMLDNLGIERTHLFGLHSGAKVAAALAAEAPGRIASVIIAGKSHSIIPDKEERARVMRAMVARLYYADGADEGFETVRGWAATQRALNGYWWDDALFTAADVKATLRGIERKIVDDLLGHRAAPAFYAANFAFDFADAVSRIATPALILEISDDREDGALGRQGERLRAYLPSAKLRTLPDVDPSALGVHADPALLADMVGQFIASIAPFRESRMSG